jgi:hypothetical protein
MLELRKEGKKLAIVMEFAGEPEFGRGSSCSSSRQRYVAWSRVCGFGFVATTFRVGPGGYRCA